MPKLTPQARKRIAELASKSYCQKYQEPVLVDHQVMMLEVFKRKGWDGVNQYFTGVVEMSYEMKQIAKVAPDGSDGDA